MQWKSDEEEFDAAREAKVDAETFTFTITELDNGVEYTVDVVAMNANGLGSPSDTVTGTPSDTSLGMIDSVMVESVGPTTAEVSVVVWSTTTILAAPVASPEYVTEMFSASN